MCSLMCDVLMREPQVTDMFSLMFSGCNWKKLFQITLGLNFLN